ncbi:MAG: hypothetical protein WD021_04155 [Rhodothermales bacterium]
MITLYRKPNDATSDDIVSSLEGLVLAHRVVEVNAGRTGDVPSDRSLPVLVEGDDVYSGEEIAQFLERRAVRLQISRQMSADACFLDPDDPDHCI